MLCLCGVYAINCASRSESIYSYQINKQILCSVLAVIIFALRSVALRGIKKFCDVVFLTLSLPCEKSHFISLHCEKWKEKENKLFY